MQMETINLPSRGRDPFMVIPTFGIAINQILCEVDDEFPKIDYTDRITPKKVYPKFDGYSDDEGEPESGWEFWSRVYDDPDLRTENNERLQNEPTISEMLKNEELIRAQIIFSNVPRIGTGSQQVIRSLIENECGKTVGIYDVSISNRRWRVRFFRSKDALLVKKAFDGYRFRNRVLSVKSDDSANDSSREQSETNESENEADEDDKAVTSEEKQYAEQLECIDECIWGKQECLQLKRFKNDLIDLLEKQELFQNAAISIDDSRIKLLNKNKYPLIEHLLNRWPVGLLRMCAPEVQLVDKYLSLQVKNQSDDDDDDDGSQKDSTEPYKESWEPLPPISIHASYHLVDYVASLLQRFGPQVMHVDLPWKILTSQLPFGFSWPRSPEQLMNRVILACEHLITIRYSFGYPLCD